jgi:tetratricopeptide (TPR) repeat protein
VVHRDIKPGNLMLRSDVEAAATTAGGDRIAITDFGLARETGTGSMTDSGAIVGTPMYMAPEIVLGGTQAASTLADVYSLGATLYTLVAGRPPFDGPTAQSVLKAVLEQDPTPPHRLRADLPPAVEAILGKAMARDPAHRYGAALEFAEDLERWLRGERVLARLPRLPARAYRWCRRRPLITALAAAVLLLSVGALLLVRERRHNAIERDLAGAERLLALASTERDEQDRVRSSSDRRDLLQAAVAVASAAIARDDSVAIAWFVRARAHHRLRQFTDAIHDLDTAERLRGVATAEILHFRIDALRHQGDATAATGPDDAAAPGPFGARAGLGGRAPARLRRAGQRQRTRRRVGPRPGSARRRRRRRPPRRGSPRALSGARRRHRGRAARHAPSVEAP